MVPYADFNLLKFLDKEKAMAKIRDLTLLSDIFPTGFHGAVTAGVGPGSIVYIACAGPVGLACAAGCQLLGAAVVIVGDMIPERLAQAKSFGCEVIDLRKDATLSQQVEQIVGEPVVDSAVDCVGFEARGHGKDAGVERLAPGSGSGRRGYRHSWPVRNRRSGRRGRGCQSRLAQHSHRFGMGEIVFFPHRAVPSSPLQQAAHAGYPARQDTTRQSLQRHDYLARRGSARLPGLRQRSGEEVCDRPAQIAGRVNCQPSRYLWFHG
jgi:hypothetical protein